MLTTTLLFANVYAVVQFKQQVIELLREGKTPRDIKALFPNMAGAFISKIRREIGMPKFKGGRPRGLFKDSDRYKQIAEMKAMGLTYSQIGRAFGFSRQRAQTYVSRQRPRYETAEGICEGCGKHHPSLNRHHPDYTKPGMVKLLCPSCHTTIHAAERKTTK